MSDSESKPAPRAVAQKTNCRQCGEQLFADQVSDAGVCVTCIVLRPNGEKPARPRYVVQEG